MNDESNHNGKNEIIIVRRSADSHDGHHGGGWKIAYADFMTAMMAFFLVMWLINAANEETKAAIAAYFNPVQLTDQKPAEKGLKDPAKDAQGEQTQQRSKVDGEQTKSGGSAKTGDQLTATSAKRPNIPTPTSSKIPTRSCPKSRAKWVTRRISASRATAARPSPALQPAPPAAKPIAIPSTRTSGPSRSR